MKKIFNFTLAMAFGLCLTSCIDDIENINPQQTTEMDADALFNKVYATFVLTGQNGPADDNYADLLKMDEGRTQYTRMLWNVNELAADEAHWYWYKNDAGYEDLIHNTFGADNAVTQGLFYRVYFNITECNLYLKYIPEDGTEETKARRAEAQLIRAMMYYTVMDLYGNGPFSDKYETGNSGEYYTRAQFFAWIEKELKEVACRLRAPRTNTYGRLDKAAAWLMLSRLYLNAEVYAGTARWQDALTYADSVINHSGYKLHDTGCVSSTGEHFTPYQMLFLADNDTNGAQNEAIFPLLHQGDKTQSYGAMHALVLQSYSPDMSNDIPSGTDNNWGKCATIKMALSKVFFGDKTDAEPNFDKVDKTKGSAADNAVLAAGDDRALMYSKGYTQRVATEGEQTHGYSCVKFRNVTSTGASTTTTNGFVDTDWPYLRFAEALLNYAEASIRLNGPNAAATAMINKLRNRADAYEQASYNLEDVLNEWAKEFWWEGRRRMDLVRFGKYGGQNEYKWEFMGNAAEGNQFPAYRNIFGIPSAEITNNPAIQPNPGY